MREQNNVFSKNMKKTDPESDRVEKLNSNKNLADIKKLKNSKGSDIQVGAAVSSFSCCLRMIL